MTDPTWHEVYHNPQSEVTQASRLAWKSLTRRKIQPSAIIHGRSIRNSLNDLLTYQPGRFESIIKPSICDETVQSNTGPDCFCIFQANQLLRRPHQGVVRVEQQAQENSGTSIHVRSHGCCIMRSEEDGLYDPEKLILNSPQYSATGSSPST